VTDFEGTGPSGGWDLHGMAQAIVKLQEDIVNINALLNLLKESIDGQELLAPAPSTIYMPKNRRNDVR
jgi:hypothetical protein